MEWIKAEDRLPEENEMVEVKSIDGYEFKAELNESTTFCSLSGLVHGLSWYDDEGDFIPHGIITHWRTIKH